MKSEKYLSLVDNDGSMAIILIMLQINMAEGTNETTLSGRNVGLEH